MRRRGVTVGALAGVALLLAGAVSPAFAQDALSRVKRHYASAEYEEALQLLDVLPGRTATTEAAAYKVYCLVALGRRDQARAAVEAIVQADPLFRPTEEQAAPGIRAFFDEVRSGMLPDVARQGYARAKVAYERRDMATAVAEFDRTIALLEEIDLTHPGVADLRVVALGFRDLARTVVAPPAVPKPEPPLPGTSAPAIASVGRTIYGPQHTDVTPAVPLTRPLPEWRPTFFELNRTFAGTLQLVVGEDGRVLFASLLKSVHPRYDEALLEAATGWTFKPATRNGAPVTYFYTTLVQIRK